MFLVIPVSGSFEAIGEHEKALELKTKVLALQQAKLGEEHAETLACMASLASR